MTAFLAGLALGLACAMWIRWDQTQALKDEIASLQRQLGSIENNRRWRGLYHHPDQDKIR